MPKRPGPLKDFKKRKAKVGKKATKAPNVTKIDLRTKKIGLPTQRISAASGASGSSDARPTTSKGVPLPDLLTQLRHYSPQSRTVALQGLKDLLARHPVVASRELGTLLEAALELLQDPESEVRSALLSFANSLLLSPQVERSSLGPYAMLSCTYVSSAISSLDLAVQRDALAFLDVMVPSFGALLLPHVPMLLSSFPTLLAKPPKPMKRKAPATGKKPDALSVWQARLSVLRTVLGLIRLDPSGSKARDRSAAAGARADGGSSSSCTTGLVILRATSQSVMQDDGGEQSRSATGAGGDEEAAGLAAVVGGLLPHLKDYLLEVITSSSAGSTGSAAASAPGGAATDEKRDQPGKAEEAGNNNKASQASSGGAPPMGLAVEAWALEALSLTLDVTMEVLARDAPGAAAAGPQPSYASLLSSVDQLFPLRLTEGASVQQGQQGDGPSGGVSLEAVNVALLEVLLESASRPTGRSKAYLLGLLQGPGLASGQGDLTARVMALLRTLLPRLQATGGASSEMAEELLAVLGPLVLTWPPSSPSARQAVRLLTDLSPARPLPAALDWLHAAALQLPAWTSAASSSSSPLQLVRTLLDSLLHFCKQPTRCQPPAWLPDVLQLLLTASAAAKTASQGHAQAPICLLPEASRKRVMELLFHCPALPAPLLASLASLLRTPGALDDETRAFAMEVLHHRRSLLTPSVYLTTLLTTLEPLQPAGGAAAVVPREHVLSAASLASRSLLLLPTPLSTLLPLLVPALTSLLRAEAPAPRLGGLSFLAHLLAGSHQQHGDDAPPLPEPLLQPLAHAIAQPDDKEEGADGTGAAMVVAMTSSSSGRELCGFRAALLSLYGASLVDLVLSEAGTSGQVECGHAERLVRVAGPKASKQALQRLLAKLGQGGAEAHSLRRQVEMVMQTGV